MHAKRLHSNNAAVQRRYTEFGINELCNLTGYLKKMEADQRMNLLTCCIRSPFSSVKPSFPNLLIALGVMHARDGGE